MPQAKPGRIDWIDIAKGGSIVFVVLHHVTLFLIQSGNSGHYLERLDYYIGSYRMPLFMFATGLVTAFLAKYGREEYFGRRIWPVLWVFLLWVFIQYAISLVMPIYQFIDFPVVEVNFLFGLIGNLWFLRAILIFFVLAYLLRNVGPGWKVATIGALALVSAADIELPVNFFQTFRYAVFFFCGFFSVGFITRHSSRAWMAIGFTVPFLGWVQAYDLLIPHISQPAFDFVKNSLGCVAGIGTAVAVAKLPVLPRFINWLGRSSLPIYILHVFMVDAIYRYLPSGTSGAMQFVLAIGLTAYAVGMSLLVYWLLRKVGMGWLFAPPDLAGLRQRFAKRSTA